VKGFLTTGKCSTPDIERFGARLMDLLSGYIQPDYIRLQVKSRDLHLHECFRRVLLSAICNTNLADVVTFDTENVRTPDSNGNPETGSSVSTRVEE
jgi:hypothetical protein